MIVTGQPIAVDYRARRTWSRQRGWQTTRQMRGLDSEIELWVEQLQQAGATEIEINPDPEPPYSTLSYNLAHADDGSPPETQVTDLWSLVGNDLEKTLWEHPKVRAVTDNFKGAGLANFRRDFNAALLQYTAPEKTPFATGLAEFSPILVAFYREVLSGVDSFPVSQYVLRRTKIVDGGTNLRPNQENVGKIFTTQQLKDSEAIPGTILFSLPDGFWLKRTPSVEPMTNGKFQFSQEWWHADNYSTFIYERVV